MSYIAYKAAANALDEAAERMLEQVEDTDKLSRSDMQTQATCLYFKGLCKAHKEARIELTQMAADMHRNAWEANELARTKGELITKS